MLLPLAMVISLGLCLALSPPNSSAAFLAVNINHSRVATVVNSSSPTTSMSIATRSKVMPSTNVVSSDAAQTRRKTEFLRHHEMIKNWRKSQKYRSLMQRRRTIFLQLQEIDLKLSRMDPLITDAEADEKLFEDIDLNKNGIIERKEFLLYLEHHRSSLQ